MSRLTLCDNCKEIIKIGDLKYILGVKETQENPDEENEIQDMETFVEKHRSSFGDVKIYEICKACKKILEHLFSMRKKERDEVLKEIKKLYEKKDNRRKKS